LLDDFECVETGVSDLECTDSFECGETSFSFCKPVSEYFNKETSLSLALDYAIRENHHHSKMILKKMNKENKSV